MSDGFFKKIKRSFNKKSSSSKSAPPPTPEAVSGEVIPSNELKTTAPLVPESVPVAPTNLEASVSSGRITLDWTACAEASMYKVFKSKIAGGQSVSGPAAAVTASNKAVVTGLIDGTTYYFKVVAINAAGRSALSDEISAIAKAPPEAPANLAAVAGTGWVALSWSPSSAATTYKVFKSTKPGGAVATDLSVAVVSSTKATIGNLDSGVTYFFKVAALNANGRSALSDEVSATPN